MPNRDVHALWSLSYGLNRRLSAIEEAARNMSSILLRVRGGWSKNTVFLLHMRAIFDIAIPCHQGRVGRVAKDTGLGLDKHILCSKEPHDTSDLILIQVSLLC